MLGQANKKMSNAIARLSSGLRINSASDDAAGLAISEKMRAQIRGLHQAERNIQDGISMLQTADGGINEIHALLQRGRELAVQASNDTLTSDDRGELGKELSQIKKQVDDIANNTEFNTIKLLNRSSGTSSSAKSDVIKYLQKGWLGASESLVQNTYGIGGNNKDIKIILDNSIDGLGGTVASLQFTPSGSPGPGSNLELHIDMSDFNNPTWPNGGSGSSSISYDRIIAHEMTHAAMAASINVSTGMQTWFMEGTAEAVQGGDERLQSTLSSGKTAQDVANLIGDGTTTAWGGTSDDYSMGYAAIRYMDHLIKSNGGTGVKDLTTWMAANPTNTLNDAIASNASLAAAGVVDTSTFATLFKSAAPGGGVDYINNAMIPNLTNTDTGALTGADATGGAIKTDSSIVDESAFGTVTTDPMSTYNEIWPTLSNGGNAPLKIQVGPNENQSVNITIDSVDSASLGILTADLSGNGNAQKAITQFDNAIQKASDVRSNIGALQNRLASSLNVTSNSMVNLTASESRIRDVDMAKEMMNETKQSILVQAAQSMLAKANQQPQDVLQLLR